MARAAVRRRREIASLGLLATLTGCAAIQNPPGGPPDFAEPNLVSISPESGSSNPDFDDRVEFFFDEVISETSGGGIANLVRVSPRPHELRVRWHRESFSVKPREGWAPNVAYRIRLLAGIQDLRGNTFTDTVEHVFTTGGPIPATVIAGTVIDWELGRAAINSLVEAVRVRDSLTFVAQTDSVGDFALRSVPPGTYTLYATVDANNNRRRDRRESFDSTLIQLTDSIARDLWTFSHDTIAPRISALSSPDSVAVEIEFSQFLDTVPPLVGDFDILALPDSTPLTITAAYFKTTYDSVAAVARAVRDSALADSIAAAQADSAAADTLPLDSLPPPEPPAAPQVDARPDTSTTDTVVPSRADSLLDSRPPLEDRIVITVDTPLQLGSRYVVVATIANLIGAREESRSLLIMPDPPPPPEEQDDEAANDGSDENADSDDDG